MKIIKVTQLDNGIQKKSYADHIYKWNVETNVDATREEVLEYCQKNLREAGLEDWQYHQKYKTQMSFGETMKMVCAGYWRLDKLSDGVWQYKVVNEYID